MSISKEIISIIEVLCQKLGIVVDWTSDTVLPQIQNVLEHFIQYEIFSSWFWIGFTLFFTVIFGILLAIANAKDCDDIFGLLMVVTLISVIALFVVAGVQGHHIVTAVYFPEKAIYDYISGLMQMR